MLFILQTMDQVRLVERLYRDHKSLMFQIAFRILNDASLAEDAVHQSFIKVIQNIHKIDETDVVKTRNFLAIICRNMALNILK